LKSAGTGGAPIDEWSTKCTYSRPSADSDWADGGHRGACDLQRQTVATVVAAAVIVGAQVDQRVEELLDQIAVGAMLNPFPHRARPIR